MWSVRDGKKIYRTFTNQSEAKGWRNDASSSVRKGLMRAPSQTTVREAWEAWLENARTGTFRKRGGDEYKPSALRGYERYMRLYILDELGAARLSAITRLDLQDLVDRLVARGCDASTVRNAIMPVRVLYRREVGRTVSINPTLGLEMPAVRGVRDRIASPADAAALIAALPDSDKPIWATAFYAGLRLGELQALEDEDIDLDAGVIHVRRSWDKYAGPIAPKSRAGERKVPIVAALRAHLAAHRLRRGERGGLFFGRDGRPFRTETIRDRAARTWTEAQLPVYGYHEARHTCASILIAAGVNAKALSTYMGHGSIAITFDRYGHLMPGNESDAAALVDRYLAVATGAQAGAHAPQRQS
ncbi:MAG TPA: tyrosine-type recombinase/integrase [Gaiellaceae bacterium]